MKNRVELVRKTAMDLIKQEISMLQNLIDQFLEGRKSIKVLEAGCGSLTHIKLPGDAYLGGINISKEKLERNKSLGEAIHGDIQTCDIPQGSFDMNMLGCSRASSATRAGVGKVPCRIEARGDYRYCSTKSPFDKGYSN